MTALDPYGFGDKESARIQDILRLLPRNRHSILDVGAKDGCFSKLFPQYFQEVTALDLTEPSFRYPGVATVAGDVTNLRFPDASFDCVFCAEVLEHVSDVASACRELARVAKHEVVIGVPFRQDIRVGRTSCRTCGKINPPFGHVQSFDEERLLALFPGLEVAGKSFVGSIRQTTNALATFLMDLAGNPWGDYLQQEPCGYCGALLTPPKTRTFSEKL